MMKTTQIGLITGFLALTFLPAVASGQADQAALEKELTEHGLVKSGRIYTHPEKEAPVIAKLNEMSPTLDRIAALYQEWAENEMIKNQIVTRNDDAIECQKQIRFRNDAIAGPRQGTAEQWRQQQQIWSNEILNYDQLKAAAIADVQKLSVRLATPGQVNAHVTEMNTLKDQFLTAKDELKPLVAELTKTTDALSKDPKVKNTLKVLGEAKKVQFKIAYSPEVTKGTQRVAKMSNDIQQPPFVVRSGTTKGGSLSGARTKKARAR